MIVPAVGALASELSLTSGTSGVGGASSVTGGQPAGAATPSVGSEGGGEGSFGGALTEAISSLEQTQTKADAASQALATGNVANPESAVVTVEDAKLAMELASQLRTKTTEAVQSIFATQV